MRERERKRESEKEDKMTWTFVGEEIMMWRCLEEKIYFSQFRVLIYIIDFFINDILNNNMANSTNFTIFFP